MRRAGGSILKRGSIPVAILLVFVVLLSASSGLYAGASFFAQQAPNVTVTTTILTTTTSWTTSTVWSTMTAVIQGVWTTVQYTTSTSTVTVTGSTTTRAPKSVTAYGNARISTAQSKFGGASGLFNGNGAYLSTPDSADWYFGTGDFTIDFWVRFNTLPGNNNMFALMSQGDDTSSNFFEIYLYNSAGTYSLGFSGKTGGTSIGVSGVATVTTGIWYNFAVSRSGSAWYLFQGGSQIGARTSSASMPDVSGVLYIGTLLEGGGLAYYFNGWLDELRISNGVARWTSNFTPPTSAPTGDSNTVLLLHMDGADGSNTFVDG